MHIMHNIHAKLMPFTHFSYFCVRISIPAGGTEKYISASLNLFRIVDGKAYPDKQYSFLSGDGSQAFTPSKINGTSFQYDQANYVLNKTYLSFDDFGNATEVIGRDRKVNAVAYGYTGTLPVIRVTNAGIKEIRYSDFDTDTPADFYKPWPPTYTVGRNNSKGLVLPAGNQLTDIITNNKAQHYRLSLWVKAAVPGNLSFTIGTNVATLPYTASDNYKYYNFKIPVDASSVLAIKLSSSTDIQIDDLALYPQQADFVTSGYTFPNGKTMDTDAQGSSVFYENDVVGRPNVIYDRNKNVVKKYSYTVRP